VVPVRRLRVPVRRGVGAGGLRSECGVRPRVVLQPRGASGGGGRAGLDRGLGGGGFFTGNFVFAAKLAGVVLVIVSAFLTWSIVRGLVGDWRFALLAGLLVASSARLSAEALSGGEATLAGALLLATAHWQARGWRGTGRQRGIAAGAAGLAALCRPELVLVLPLVLVDRALVAWTQETPGRRLRRAAAMGLPEVVGAGIVLAPYVVFNWQAGGPLWQQPEAALRAQPALLWPAAVLAGLWRDNPMLLCAAVVGLPVMALAAARARTEHPSFLTVLALIALATTPGLLWRQASAANAAYAVGYLTPLVAIVGSGGLFFAHRVLKEVVLRRRGRGREVGFAAGMAAVVVAVFALAAAGHGAAWREHGLSVKRVSGLQGYIGEWAADHVAPDASIASREVGAIGFFSRRRMVDLGGTIDQEGWAYLSRPGPADTNLLAFLQDKRPSHVVMRPADFPDLSQRVDLLVPAVTCVVTDPISGGQTTMALYETPWPPVSVRGVRGQAGGG
jgi:hypothetical protein